MMYKPKIKIPSILTGYNETVKIVSENKLHTVCQEAACPNIVECWNKKHAAFMILGSVCTRACKFCNVKTGIPDKLDPHEPERLAFAVLSMKLQHVVITSVDRDDLDDGGAEHFANTISAIRKLCPQTTIEVLTPDFRHKSDAFHQIVHAKPDVYNHNIETVPSLYHTIRPGARYFQSLWLLNEVKRISYEIFTKSGIMLGLGETKVEVLQVMDDLRSANVDFLTIGQYLQPSIKHAKVERYVSIDEFESYRDIAYAKGFLMVSSSPLTRSSYHADSDFKIMQKRRRDGITRQEGDASHVVTIS